MSYDSKFKNERASQLISSTQIAVVISLVLHLLLFKYGFPRFSIADKITKEKLNVPIIELSPLEQSRLPNLYPELDIPEFENTPLSSEVPPFALPPSIPINPNLFQDLPPVPLPPPPPEFPLPPLPPLPSFPTTDIKLPPLGDISSLPLPPPPTEGDAIKKPEQPIAPPEAKKDQPPPPKPEVKASESSSPPKPKLSPQQIAAVRQQNLNQQVRQLGQSLQKKDENTTNEEATKNYVSWLNEVKEATPQQLVIQGTYPRDACIRRLEGKSFYGVLVNSQGQVIDLELLKNANYPIFNEQASKDIGSRNFANNTGKPKPYQVEVNFKYDAEICPSLTLPSLRRDDKPKSPTPEVKPEVPPKQETPTPITPEVKPEVPPKQETPTPITPEVKPEVPPKQETPTPITPEVQLKPNNSNP
jgi:outer membrane biosynthesis protein TonB